MSETTMKKARQVVHRLSEWYFAEGGDNDPDSPIDREDLDVLHDLVRAPRGEEEAWRAFLDALDEFEAAANLWVDPEGPTAEDMARLDRARQRVIECARALATIRPEAQGEDRWEDVVFGPITEAYNEAHAARRGEGGGDGD